MTEKKFPLGNLAILLWLIFLSGTVLPAQCVPEMNDIRDEIRDIRKTALTSLHWHSQLESQNGWKFVREKKLRKAARAFREALQLNPDCWNALAGQAHLAYLARHPLSGEKLYKKSRAAFQRFRKTIPETERQLNQCHERIRIVMNRLDLHESMYAIQDKGESYDPSHQQERVQVMDDWIKTQLTVLRKWKQSEYPPGLCLIRGNDLSRAGNWQSAEKWYRAGLKSEPNNGRLHRNLAVCLMVEGQSETAREEALKALQLGTPIPIMMKKQLKLPDSTGPKKKSPKGESLPVNPES